MTGDKQIDELARKLLSGWDKWAAEAQRKRHMEQDSRVYEPVMLKHISECLRSVLDRCHRCNGEGSCTVLCHQCNGTGRV